MLVHKPLRPWRLLAAAFLAFAVLAACASVAGALPKEFDLVYVSFVGDGYASFHNGAVTDFSAGAWWEEHSIPVDVGHTPIQIDQPDEIDEIRGTAVETYVSPGRSCSGTYAPLQATRPGVATSAGVRFWTHADYPGASFGPDPGNGEVLVSAWPYFGDYVRVSGNCNPGDGPLDSLMAYWKHNASCVVQTEGECSATVRLPKVTQSCGVGCARTYAGVATIKVKRIGLSRPFDPIPELLTNVVGLDLPFLDSIPLLPRIPPPPEPPPIVITRPPVSGTVDDTVYGGKGPVLHAKGKVTKGVPAKLPVALVPAGVAALRRITAPTLLTAVASFTPVGKPTQTLRVPFYVLPAQKSSGGGGGGGGGGAKPTITSVTFRGSAAKPAIAVHGRNLGSKPKPSPPQHPSGLNGCPVIAGDTGYDYGTSLYLFDAAQNWAGGRYRPQLGETDCVDLVVTKFTSSEVDFHFGPAYASSYPKFALTPGTQAQIVVNGAAFTATVKY